MSHVKTLLVVWEKFDLNLMRNMIEKKHAAHDNVIPVKLNSTLSVTNLPNIVTGCNFGASEV